MPITRTPWIDDDGTGTTGTIINNAEKQLLYDQIDAALASLVAPTVGAITAIDASGAGLGVLGSGLYQRYGALVVVTISIGFPATADGAIAAIGGLPFPQKAAFYGGLYVGYSVGNFRCFIENGTTVATIVNAVDNVPLSNAALSGAGVHLHGGYFTD